MTRDVKSLFQGAFELPENAPDPNIEEAWAIEAERRWREIESGEVETIPWEEMRWHNHR